MHKTFFTTSNFNHLTLSIFFYLLIKNQNLTHQDCLHNLPLVKFCKLITLDWHKYSLLSLMLFHRPIVKQNVWILTKKKLMQSDFLNDTKWVTHRSDIPEKMRVKSKICEIWNGITIEPICLLFALSQGFYAIVSKVNWLDFCATMLSEHTIKIKKTLKAKWQS